MKYCSRVLSASWLDNVNEAFKTLMIVNSKEIPETNGRPSIYNKPKQKQNSHVGKGQIKTDKSWSSVLNSKFWPGLLFFFLWQRKNKDNSKSWPTVVSVYSGQLGRKQ